MPSLGDEVKTDPRIKVHFQNLSAQLDGIANKIDTHVKHDEERFESHARRFVSYKWLIGLLGGALTVGGALAAWTIKTAGAQIPEVKKDVMAVIQEHTMVEQAQVQAVQATVQANAVQQQHTSDQVDKIVEAIVDGKIKKTH
jgi:hypothetical protein